MPKILEKPTGQLIEAEPTLRPYRHHGVTLEERGGGQATAGCPFCGRDGKLSVEVESGLYRCLVCASSGNPLTFLRTLWERSDATTNGQAKELADDRGYLDRSTLTAWGVARSISDGSWLVPGYSVEAGKPRLDQLYRRTRMKKKEAWTWSLLPTPGVWPDGKAHALHMPSMDFDPGRPCIMVFEGPWDAMAFWEVARQTKRNDDGSFDFTGNPACSVIADSNVVAVPGCNVWRPEWTELCRGKAVTLFYDNDHPREHPEGSGNFTMAGHDGAKRVAGLIGAVAASVTWLQWGGGGFDGTLPSGFDVRDWLVKGVPS